MTFVTPEIKHSQHKSKQSHRHKSKPQEIISLKTSLAKLIERSVIEFGWFQGFDWPRLGSVIKHNQAHPKFCQSKIQTGQCYPRERQLTWFNVLFMFSATRVSHNWVIHSRFKRSNMNTFIYLKGTSFSKFFLQIVNKLDAINCWKISRWSFTLPIVRERDDKNLHTYIHTYTHTHTHIHMYSSWSNYYY